MSDYIKEILSGLGLIAFGVVLSIYTDDISKWFGDTVQNIFNSIIEQL